MTKFVREASCICGLAAVFLGLLLWSWRMWPDVLIDFGHELYIPWQITQGKILYEELTFTMGPLSQYINALLFKVFGISLNTLVFANLFVLGLILAMLYWICHYLASEFDSALICVVFLVIFAFSQYTGAANYNYVCPYRHEMTHGILLLLFLVLTFHWHAIYPKILILGISGFTTGLIFLTKTEILLASISVALFGIGIHWRINKISFPQLLKTIVVILLGTLLPILAAIILLARQMSFIDAFHNVFANFFYAANNNLTTNYKFYITNMGLDDIHGNVVFILKSFAAALGFVLALSAVDYLVAARFHRNRFFRIVITACSMIICIHFTSFNFWESVVRIVPLTTILFLCVFLVHSLINIKNKEKNSQFRLCCLWSVMALGLLAKMLLKARISHYGFVLAMPATLLLVACGYIAIPRLLQQEFGKGAIFKAVYLGIVIGISIIFFNRSSYFYNYKTVAIGKGSDQFLTYDSAMNPKGSMIKQAMVELERRMDENSTLLVLPEGVTMNYLMKKPNPTPYYLLTPWEMKAFGGEKVILRNISENAPDFIAVLNINMKDHGRSFFGEKGYGQEIMTWILKDYSMFKRLRTTPYNEKNFRIDLYQHRL